MKKHVKTVFLALLLATGAPATAEEFLNEETSKLIILGKTKAKQLCASCHNQNGISKMSIYPNLAKQHSGYLEKQLLDYKKGQEGRYNPIMYALTNQLSTEDIKSLSMYYSTQSANRNQTIRAEGDEEKIEQGKELYEYGSSERKITACSACHGQSGEGIATARIPKLNNQNGDYIKSQLYSFREGKRNNDMNKMMRIISKKLSDEDVENLSKYLSSIK